MKTSDSISPHEVEEITHAVNRRFRKQTSAPLDEAIVSLPDQLFNRDSFEFAIGGCQYPAGLLDVEPAYAAYARFAAKLRTQGVSTDAVILTGDQIYADATAGLFDPTQLDDHYRRSYERLLQKPAVREVMRQVPIITMLDDHEISDNYEPVNSTFNTDTTASREAQLQLAIRNYSKYQRGSGPYPNNKVGKIPANKLWYSLESHALPIFVGNTRTERQNRHAVNIEHAKIMHDQQYEALKNWLLLEELQPLPKLIVTPSIFLPRHTAIQSNTNAGSTVQLANALRSDSWDGYPASFHDLLAFITDNEIRNIVFISGDEHLGCACRATLSKTEVDSGETRSTVIHSIHTSALYAPYPFANARPNDLIAKETFALAPVKKMAAQERTQNYSCAVESVFYPGFGFTFLTLGRNSQGVWQLSCEFNRESAHSTGHYNSALG